MSVIINGSAGVTTNSGAVYDSLQRATAVTASGTSVDFTSIPSWVRRITIMLIGLSTNGIANPLVQLGTGATTYTTSGYLGATTSMDTGVATTNYTTGFGIRSAGAVNVMHGTIVLTNTTGNSWTASGNVSFSNAAAFMVIAGSVPLSAALTAVRLYIDGTQQFDAGTINIIYE